MILEEHFYHNTISLYTAIFGTIFDNIKIKRDNKTISVPLAYAEKQKYNGRLEENPDPNAVRYQRKTPRISYQLVGWNRDSTRVKNKMHKLAEQSQVGDTRKTQYNRVPYTFNYQVNITAKYVNDMLQMLEQIMVYFNPSIQVVVKDNPDLERESSVNITMLSSSKEDAFDGSFDEKREITATLDFTLDGYLYMPTSETGVIKKITLNYDSLIDPSVRFDQTVIEAEE